MSLDFALYLNWTDPTRYIPISSPSQRLRCTQGPASSRHMWNRGKLGYVHPDVPGRTLDGAKAIKYPHQLSTRHLPVLGMTSVFVRGSRGGEGATMRHRGFPRRGERTHIKSSHCGRLNCEILDAIISSLFS